MHSTCTVGATRSSSWGRAAAAAWAPLTPAPPPPPAALPPPPLRPPPAPGLRWLAGRIAHRSQCPEGSHPLHTQREPWQGSGIVIEACPRCMWHGMDQPAVHAALRADQPQAAQHAACGLLQIRAACASCSCHAPPCRTRDALVHAVHAGQRLPREALRLEAVHAAAGQRDVVPAVRHAAAVGQEREAQEWLGLSGGAAACGHMETHPVGRLGSSMHTPLGGRMPYCMKRTNS